MKAGRCSKPRAKAPRGRLRAVLMTAAAMIFGMVPAGDRIRRRRPAGRAARPRGHRRPARLHLRHADHPAVDLRDPATERVHRFPIPQPDGSREPIL